jgi:tetratricopeptide (TPR) repeat protein
MARAPSGRVGDEVRWEVDTGLQAALEDERDFCLRSLRDLEAERDAGDIDDADYEFLKDAYTARAAAALRALATESNESNGSNGSGEDGSAGPADGPAVGRVGPATVPGGPATGAGGPDTAAGGPGTALAEGVQPATAGVEAAPGRHRWRKWAVVSVGVVVVAAGAGWAVAASSATRLPGQEITGQALGSQAEAQTLLQAQQSADRGDDVSALKDYQKVLDSDPNQPEALTGKGWILAETQQPTLLQQGLTMLLAAEKADPTYAPAHVYRGISLLSEGDYTDAIPELKWYLAHGPDPSLAPRVRAALQQAETKSAAAKG